MKRINQLKFTGIVATVGLAAVVFGSGVYAGGNSKEENDVETSAELITLDLTPAEERVDDTKEELVLAAGAGEVFQEVEIDDNIDEAAEIQVLNEEIEAEPETYWGYTNLGIAHVDNHLNIREEPNENGKLVGKLSKDAACEILDIDDNGWAHIKSGKVEGYCSTDYLYMGDEAIARGKEVASMIAVVNTETLKVREEPNTDCAVITLIPQDEELEVVDIMENGWIKFLLDDEEAYVSGEYVDVEERLEKAVTLTELLYG
jgi:hypothetical protein